MDLKTARERALAVLGEARATNADARALVEVGRAEGQGKDFFEQLAAMTPSGFPIPELILFGFTQLLDLPRYGPEEKMRWGIIFTFRDVQFAYELRKFGLRLLCERAQLGSPLLREIRGRTLQLTDVVEAHLRAEVVPAQLAAGAVTVRNMFSELSERYVFLRKQALEAYAKPPPPLEHGSSSDGYFTWSRQDIGRPNREGGTLATAAVDAYYSRLEHFLVLASAFNQGALASGGLSAVLGAGWTERAQRVLDLSDPVAKKHYDNLYEIRVAWRNPLAHGGFHTGDASLWFHLPDVGALPARLRRTPAGVKAGFQLPPGSFEDICATFDQFDAWLHEGVLRHATQWAESALDVAFDPRTLREYTEATKTDDSFAALIERHEYLAELHANMDY